MDYEDDNKRNIEQTIMTIVCYLYIGYVILNMLDIYFPSLGISQYMSDVVKYLLGF